VKSTKSDKVLKRLKTKPHHQAVSNRKGKFFEKDLMLKFFSSVQQAQHLNGKMHNRSEKKQKILLNFTSI
jgi:hypothetical protein